MVSLLAQTQVPQSPVLYVPDGAVKNEGEPVLIGQGTRTTSGKYISSRTWRFTNRSNGRTQVCCLMDDEMSDDAIAQAKGEARDNFLRETNGLPKLVTPTSQQSRDVGSIIRQIRANALKRTESTNGKLFYKGSAL